jgi:hypothetical protein
VVNSHLLYQLSYRGLIINIQFYKSANINNFSTSRRVVNPATAGLYQLSYRGLIINIQFYKSANINNFSPSRRVVNPATAGLYQLSYRGSIPYSILCIGKYNDMFPVVKRIIESNYQSEKTVLYSPRILQ